MFETAAINRRASMFGLESERDFAYLEVAQIRNFKPLNAALNTLVNFKLNGFVLFLPNIENDKCRAVANQRGDEGLSCLGFIRYLKINKNIYL